jgi:LmbE family N-acetylglucosaminyl deacetylase
MNVLADHQVQRALVIIAHPDDAEFWAGGTIARWTDAGAASTYLVLTDGDAGGFDPPSGGQGFEAVTATTGMQQAGL